MVQSPLVWVTGTSRRFNSNPISMDCANPHTDNEAVSNSEARKKRDFFGRPYPIVAEIVPSRTMSDRMRTGPNWV